tara:strand:+ start:35 stop:880 length:846 start_codon:yes stop_codon:yes gene_type:complete
MENILVLGSRGQIGLSLTKILRNSKKYNVIECDLVCSENNDLREKSEFLNQLFQTADFVYFLAYDVGGSKYLYSNQNSSSFLNNNLLLMLNTFSYLEKYSNPFIFASTQMSNMHHSPYGTLKRIGEHYTNILGGHIVRFWNTYGIENDKEKTHVITDFINSALSQKSILMRTNGNETRQFLHADDCGKALITIQENYEEIEKRYLDITSFKWSSIYEVAKVVSNIFGNLPIKRGAQDDLVQNNISNEPDPYFKKYWEPEISLEDGISSIVKYMIQSKKNSI